MKKLKTIIGLIIAFVIGVSTTVGATTIFSSKDITYSNSATSKTNVKDSLDELYTKASKVGQCPDEYSCLKFNNIVEVGDYIKMTPTSTAYNIECGPAGTCANQETINPSRLDLWRVIRKNADGTIDVVSEYVSNEKLTFKGSNGYKYLISLLNYVAKSFTNDKYVSSTRYLGYSNQTESCSSLESCQADNGYETDVNLVKEAIGTLVAKTPSGIVKEYWVASRSYGYNPYKFYGAKKVNTEGNVYYTGDLNPGTAYLYRSDGNSMEDTASVRPILTLKSDIQVKRGNGKSASTAYELK